jgi:uncharacterized membrane protein (DUF485 family)
MANAPLNWSAIDADPRFKDLHAKKSSFLWGLMIFAVIYYFLLPIGAAYFPELYKIKVWGPINFGLLFALSQFLVAWGIAWYYARKASQFDAMADAIARDAQKIGGKR